jgi:DNA-directed RNA polymerases I, II, and III subunit RPABC3
LALRLLDGSIMQDLHRRSPKKSMMDDFEYVMHGKVYKLQKQSQKDKDEHSRTVVYVSFGGLLCQLIADHENLNSFELDSMIYLLMRKI